MTREKGARVCKYPNCKHGGKVNIEQEVFVKEKGSFYHEDCYKDKVDLQLFRNIWVENISSTVVYSQLNQMLNQFISKGISTKYLLFTLQYVIDNHLNLKYPAGFKYYIDYPKIKEAYQKSVQRKIVSADFTVKDDGCDNAPKFSFKRKPSGFNSILRR